MARFVEYGVQPSEFEALNAAAAHQLLRRLEKRRGERERADGELRKSEGDALFKSLENLGKGLKNIAELVAKRPTL